VADGCGEATTASRTVNSALLLVDCFYLQIWGQISGGMDAACYNKFGDKKLCFINNVTK
jgi:hypothetical protein